MKRRYTYASHPAVALALSLVLLWHIGCPRISESNLDKAAKASRTIATRYVEVVDFIGTLWDGKVITSIETKDRLADALIKFGEGGKKFNGLLAQFSALHKDGNVPPNGWKVIVDNFDVLNKEFLEILNLIPGAPGLSSNAAFRAISAAILAIAQTLTTVGYHTPNIRTLEREVRRHGLA